ncbi:hypothetical protein FQR65_LT08613 [Abscondita terminalis]|nr:hypothetical protein FQR65_LT08613 [Abscondita terminalis]
MDKIDPDIMKILDSRKSEVYKAIKEFSIRNTDVILSGYPKSGTTWAQEMIWLIMNDLDYEGAKTFVDARVPIIEMSQYLFEDMPHSENFECHSKSLEFVEKLKDPRFKDILAGRQDHYWEHVLYFWERRNWPNVLFIKYEDMKNDLAQMIRKVATFLEKTLTENEVLELMKWLDFETMKNNAAVNHNSLYKKSGFIRSGKVGDHKKVMSDEVNKIFDSWIEENLKNTDYAL